MDIIDLSATDLAALVRRGQISPEDIAGSLIDEVARVNPALNAIIRFDPDLIRAEAARVRNLIASGAPAPLAGVPFTAKDNLWVEGQVASQGSRLFEHFVAPHDAVAVERLRAHGAMILGLTNCSEFACKGLTTNLLFGATRNPWDQERTPGGSSGGAASAVSAGLGALALGTDAGGSVRRPAAHVGVFGMKPSPGRIPHPVGFAEPVFGQSVIGVMARTAADLRLSFNALCAYDARDPMSAPYTPGEPGTLEGLRVAYSPRLGLGFPVDQEVQAAVSGTMRFLEHYGCHIEEADPAWPAGTDEAALMPLQFGGLAALYGDAWRQSPERFDPDIGKQIEQGLRLSASDMARAWFLREEMLRALTRFQAGYDLLITPTTPCVAWPLDRLGPDTIEKKTVSPRGHAVFTPIFNHTFVPACSVPCDVAPGSLPIGLQIVGRRYEDELVLTAASAIEAASGAKHARPRRVAVHR